MFSISTNKHYQKILTRKALETNLKIHFPERFETWRETASFVYPLLALPGGRWRLRFPLTRICPIQDTVSTSALSIFPFQPEGYFRNIQSRVVIEHKMQRSVNPIQLGAIKLVPSQANYYFYTMPSQWIVVRDGHEERSRACMLRCDDDKSQEHEQAWSGRRSCRRPTTYEDNDENKHRDTHMYSQDKSADKPENTQLSLRLPANAKCKARLEHRAHRTIFTENEYGMRIGQRLAPN